MSLPSCLSSLAVCALTFAALTTNVLAQQPKVLAPHRPIAPRLPDNPPTTGPVRSMVGGLWMIDSNFKCKWKEDAFELLSGWTRLEAEAFGLSAGRISK